MRHFCSLHEGKRQSRWFLQKYSFYLWLLLPSSVVSLQKLKPQERKCTNLHNFNGLAGYFFAGAITEFLTLVAIGATTGPITPTIVITTTDAAGGDGGDVVDPTVCKFFLKSLACVMMTRGGVGRRAKPQGFADLSFVLSSVLDSQIHIHFAAGLSNWKCIQR